MMFLGLRKLGNVCCGHKMFLNKIRNIFCVPDTKFVSATNVARAGKRGNICVGNNVSATMCPRLPGPLNKLLAVFQQCVFINARVMYVFELHFHAAHTIFALITCHICPLLGSFTHQSFTRSLKLIFALIHATRMISKTHLDITLTEMSYSVQQLI